MNATAVLHPFSSALVPAALRKVWVTSSLHMVLAVPQTVEPLKYLYIFFYESAQGRELLFRITCWPSGKHCALTWNWRAQHMRRVETRQSSTMYFLCKYSRIPFRAFDSSSMFACIKLWMHSRWGWNRLDYFGFHMGTFPGPVFGVPAQQALEQRNFFFLLRIVELDLFLWPGASPTWCNVPCTWAMTVNLLLQRLFGFRCGFFFLRNNADLTEVWIWNVFVVRMLYDNADPESIFV